MRSASAIVELTRMRLLLLLRQPEILFWAFVFPILLSIVLGLAFRDAQPGDLGTDAAAPSGGRYVDWFFPGLLGLGVMSTSIWGVGFAFVDARQKKLIRRFLVTPVKRTEFLLAHVLARLALLVIEALVLLLFARLVLGVPMRGSYAALAVVCLVGALVFSGIGVLLGSRVRTLEAAAGLINLSMMPMGLASGVFFSYERFAPALQPWIRALPLAAFNDALRAVMLDGKSLPEVAHWLVIQLVWGVAAFLIGLAIFRWQ